MNKFVSRFALVGAGVSLVAAQAHAAGTDAISAALTAIDLSSVVTTVGVIGVAVIGIVMAFKGIDLGKRAVKKA
ncbi:hypothetical protein PSQ39_21615 [Curvibacter sp. HBC28]|uniref:Phage coat protein n=1 Tax=Curvibacter microcysteis TaxID=3026419 RepID=A0ABT5MN15_9BURK|nr:hypothetical protein [Curvibacter sp. HBC28]MDD0817247.1 hypothetical protein [Curvibacter sp. HBC28]